MHLYEAQPESFIILNFDGNNSVFRRIYTCVNSEDSDQTAPRGQAV